MPPRSLPVRLYHWLQAAGFVLASQVLAFGDTPHRAAGFGLAGLVAARVVWGLVGAPEDRLSRHRIALCLMTLMLLTVLTGHLQTTDRYWGEAWMMALHAGCSNLLTALVLLHVGTQLWRSRHWQTGPLRRMLWIRRADDAGR